MARAMDDPAREVRHAFGFMSIRKINTGERLDNRERDRMAQLAPKISKIRKVKKTVNLINQDDCTAAIAFFTYRAIREHHPLQHAVQIQYLDWSTARTAKKKQEVLAYLFEHYDPLWQIRVEQKNNGLAFARFTFPGLSFLTFG